MDIMYFVMLIQVFNTAMLGGTRRCQRTVLLSVRNYFIQIAALDA